MHLEFIPANAGRLTDLSALLRQTKLPVEDLPEGLPHFSLVYLNGRLVGSAGLELYGDAALLRSVAVHPDAQGQGVGNQIFNKMLDYAVTKGVRELWLITDSAEGYFSKLGFQRVERAETHPAIAETAQFRSVCPSSAVVMRRIT